MVSNSRRCLPRRSAVIFVLLPFLMILAFVSTVSAQLGTPVASSSPAEPTTVASQWLEFGPDGRRIARVITQAECPALVTDGLDLDMTRRAPASDAFPVLSCEATVPFGTEKASILGQELPLPMGPIRRIAVLGDTGCRVNDWEKKYQACNDPESWPFAEVAQAVADWDPDLIVHAGDYLYRESPCPNTMAGCQDNPHGDNWATWDADFFTPATSVLAPPHGCSCVGITRPAIATLWGGLPSLIPGATNPHVNGLPSPTLRLCVASRSRSSTPRRPRIRRILRRRRRSTGASLTCWPISPPRGHGW